MASPNVLACSKALLHKGWTISFVESASAGRLSYEFSTVPDSGEILIGGMVCYNACMKEDILNIPTGMIEQFTPESAEVTKAMAESFAKYSASDVCVGLTGLTTPGGSETPEKPVGTIFIHIIFPDKQLANRSVFEGSAEEIVRQAVDQTASLIVKEID
jgi:nicotinamide-nucleotide amidase